jgi:hypothetical protein
VVKILRMDRSSFGWPSIIFYLIGGGPVFGGGVGQLHFSNSCCLALSPFRRFLLLSLSQTTAVWHGLIALKNFSLSRVRERNHYFSASFLLIGSLFDTKFYTLSYRYQSKHRTTLQYPHTSNTTRSLWDKTLISLMFHMCNSPEHW